MDAQTLAALLAETRARLTGPGGEFEIVERDVLGRRLPVFARTPASLHEVLLGSGEFGDREYLVQGDHRLSFAEHVDAVSCLAALLRERFGVRRGDRVAVFGANSPAWVIAFWAAAELGAVTVGYNAWWSGRELEHALGLTTPSVVIADDEHLDLLRRAGTEVPALSFGETLLAARSAGVRAGEPAAATLPGAAVDPDDPAVIMFTSGTTGFPKGAVHSHRTLLSVLTYHRLNDAIVAQLGLPTSGRRFLMSLPLFHIASLHNLAIPRLATGDTVVIDSGRFDVDRVLRLVEREHVTHWALVPTMAHRLVSAGDLSRYDLSSLAAMSVNSAPSSEALKDRLRRSLPTVASTLADSYGLTESSTAATVAGAADLAAHPGTVGRPIALVDLQIRGADGEPVPEGTDGEIHLRSVYNMLGYWNDPDATASAFDADGWLRTGDLGRVDGGLLYMSSRRTDLILRGGENVYPAEIEAVLDEHPAVLECAVFGVESEDLGETVAAVVVTADPDTVDTEDLAAFVRERLAYYKVPQHWRVTTAPLPRTATGKVVRSHLR